jgi:hypothetical protein
VLGAPGLRLDLCVSALGFNSRKAVTRIDELRWLRGLAAIMALYVSLKPRRVILTACLRQLVCGGGTIATTLLR